MAFTIFVARSDSNVIDWLSYDHEARRMRVHFKSTDSTWEYERVWPSDFASLVAAHSVGRAFNANIRGKYVEKRISPPPVAEQATMF